MKIQERKITSECFWEDGLYIAKILQEDANNIDPTSTNLEKFKYGLTAKFDEELVLRDINVDYLQGSRKNLCSPVKETLQQLVGVKVGKSFGWKIMQLSGENFCMHFELLLPQLAALVYRARLFRTGHEVGREELVNLFSNAFKGKCVGWTNRDDSLE